MSAESMPFGRGWRVHFEHDFMRDGWTMQLWRNVGDEIETVSADMTATRYDPGVRIDGTGIYLPGDAYEAIVTAIDPPAHAAEVRRLEDALALERSRVDRVLFPAPSPQGVSQDPDHAGGGG